MTARASGKPGDGSNSDGGRIKTPCVPSKAAVRVAASSMSAVTTSHPSSAHERARAASRTTARTGWPAASNVRATAPPTFPVIPVIAYIAVSPCVDRCVPISGRRSGVLQAVIQPLLELSVQIHHTRVVERQDLREQRAGHLPDRIDPEIAVQQSRPADTARAAAMRTRLGVYVEGEPPLVRRPGKLVEAVRPRRLRRLHFGYLKISDLILEHRRNGVGTQDPLAAVRPTVHKHLQERHVIARCTECTAATHKELGPLVDLERSGLERSVGLPVVHCCHSPLLRAADQKARIAHAERRENVLPEVDLQ